METEIVTTLANSSNAVLMLLLASGPLFGAGIIYMAYKLGHRFGDRFIKAMDDIAEQTKLMGQIIESMREEIEDVKTITTDNNRRLEIIEKTGLPHNAK